MWLEEAEGIWQAGQSSTWQWWARNSAAGSAPSGVWGERRAVRAVGRGGEPWGFLRTERIWSQTDTV